MPNIDLTIAINASVAQATTAIAQVTDELQDTASAAVSASKALDGNNASLAKVASSAATASKAQDSVTKALASSAIAAGKLDSSLGKSAPGIKAAGSALTDLGRVAQDLPFGFVGIQNNLSPLLESFQRLKTESGGNQQAFKALLGSLTGAGGIGLVLSAVTAAVTFASVGFGAWTKILGTSSDALDKTAEAAKRAKDQVQGVFDSVAKEVTSVQSLVVVLESESATRERKVNALKDLQKIQPDIFAGLKVEGDTVVGLTAAYDKYLSSLNTIIAARIKQQQLESVTSDLLKAQGITLTGYAKTLADGTKALAEFQKAQQANDPSKSTTPAIKQQIEGQKEVNRLTIQQSQLLKELGELQAGIKVGDNSDTLKQTRSGLDQIAETLRKLKIDRDELAQNPIIKIGDKPLKEIDLILSAIGRLRDLKATDAVVLNLRAQLQPLLDANEAERLHERIQKLADQNVQPIKLQVELSQTLNKKSGLVNILEDESKQLENYRGKTAEKLAGLIFDPKAFKDAAANVAQIAGDEAAIIANTVANGLISIGESLGTGGNLFEGLFRVIGSGIKQLGEYLITTSSLIAGIQKALRLALAGNPIVGVALGIGLVAIGSALENIPKFATGGVVTSPTLALIGEAGPERVTPLGQEFGGSGGSDGVLQARVSGNDLLILYDRARRQAGVNR